MAAVQSTPMGCQHTSATSHAPGREEEEEETAAVGSRVNPHSLTHGVEGVGGDDSVVSSLRVTLRETQRVVVGGVHLDAMAVEVLA